LPFSEVLLKDSLKLFKNLVNWPQSVNLAQLIQLAIEFNDGHGFVSEGSESLTKGLNIVVVSSTGLRSLLNALNHGIFVSVKENTEGDVNWIAQNALPTILVILIAGEAIDQEALLIPSMLLHASFQELASDINRDDLTLNDVLIDQSGSIWSGVSL
jgi:hypothetical protein